MLTVETLPDLMKEIETSLAGAQERLTELDAAAGDGDLGVNMALGFRSVCDELRQSPPETLAEGFGRCALAFNRAAPSTLGTILSAGLLSFSSSCEGLGEIGAARLSELLDSAMEAMMDLGGASFGDKTILDAVKPYADFLRSSPLQGPALLHGAAEAAEEAALATAGMSSRIGRARMYGDKTKGICDGGAVAFSLMAKGIASFAEKTSA